MVGSWGLSGLVGSEGRSAVANKKAALRRGSLEQADSSARHRDRTSWCVRRRRTENAICFDTRHLMVSGFADVNSRPSK